MTKENSKKGESAAISVIKKIGFIILIVLIFSPLSFLISNTVTENLTVPDSMENCWSKYDSPVYSKSDLTDADIAERDRIEELRTKCEENNDLLQVKKSTSNFIIVSIINIVVIVTLLFALDKIDPIVSYSMFFSAGINSMIIIIGNVNRINSLLGVSLGVILFVLTMIFINKNLKKEKSN